jgi:hypothetical protein
MADLLDMGAAVAAGLSGWSLLNYALVEPMATDFEVQLDGSSYDGNISGDCQSTNNGKFYVFNTNIGAVGVDPLSLKAPHGVIPNMPSCGQHRFLLGNMIGIKSSEHPTVDWILKPDTLYGKAVITSTPRGQFHNEPAIKQHIEINESNWLRRASVSAGASLALGLLSYGIRK